VATEKHPFIGRLLTTIIGGLAVIVIYGVVSYLWPNTAPTLINALENFFSHPIPLWLILTLFLAALALLFLLSRLVDPNRIPKRHLTEVFGPLWCWYVFGDSLHLFPVPLCPKCKNDLTITDKAIWPAPPYVSKYPDRHAAHVACSRGDYEKTFNDAKARDFQSAAHLYAAVERELRRRINTKELKP
jgi:hypothetical protein